MRDPAQFPFIRSSERWPRLVLLTDAERELVLAFGSLKGIGDLPPALPAGERAAVTHGPIASLDGPINLDATCIG